VGTILADDPGRNVSARIQLGSTDSLRGKTLPPVDLLVIDEAHRALNASSQAIIGACPGAVLLGLTATPVRLDRRPLALAFDNLIVAASMSELFAAGRIVRPRVYSIDPKDLPDLSGISITGGDYNLKQLSAVFSKKPLVGHIVEHWLQRAEGRQTIVAATSLAHGAMIAAEFREHGVAAETIDGTMSNTQRADILARFGRREYPVLVQCELLIEGIDIPDVKCIVMARRTLSLTIFLQIVGRSVRPAGDQTAIVLDHAGNTHIHGPPDMDRDWTDIFHSGTKRKRAGSSGDFPVKTCPECLRTIAAGCATCPHEDCAHVFTSVGAMPKHVDGTLIEMPAASVESPVERWRKVCASAHQYGHDYPWAAARYRSLYNVEPESSWELGERPKVEYTPAMKRAALSRLYSIASKKGFGDAWVHNAYAREVGEFVAPSPRSLPDKIVPARAQLVPQIANPTEDVEF
jgi:hypothetical protein